MWVWCLGTKQITDHYNWHLKIRGDDGHVLLSVQSCVHSLSTVSWQEIVDLQMGICLSTQTLNSFKIAANSEVLFDIEVAKTK